MASATIYFASSYPVDELGRGARRLAKKSANRLSEPAIARRIQGVNRLLRSERQCKLKLGDALVTLIDKFRLRPIDIARAVKGQSNHLSEMYYTSKFFPPKVRKPNIPYTIYWTAMRTVRKFRQLDPMDTLAEIAANGFTQHRQVTNHFAAKMRRRENHAALVRSTEMRGSSGFNRCYHAKFQDLLSVFPDDSIKILSCDPPYANYRRVADGRYTGGSVRRTTCDNPTAPEAIAMTVDLLRNWGPKIAAGGVLLLWQASGPLRERVARAVDDHGWEIEVVVIWDQGRVQPGNFESPYSVQCEWLWVLKRRGVKLLNHDQSDRGDIIRFTPVHRLVDTADHEHAFEKPSELCEFLVGKHSYEGEIVFDVCACTGTMSVAAARMNRRWVYCESNATNYQIGSKRIARSLPANMRTAG